MPQMAEKDIASRAAELCGGALTYSVSSPSADVSGASTPS